MFESRLVSDATRARCVSTPCVPGASWPIGPRRRQARADLTAKGTHHPHLPLGGVAKCARPSLLLLGLKACTAVRCRPVRWPTLGAAELPAALAERGRFFATGIDIRTPWTGGGSGSRPGVGGASSAPAPVGLPRGVGVALHVADERIERQHLLSCTSLESTTPRLCVCVCVYACVRVCVRACVCVCVWWQSIA